MATGLKLRGALAVLICAVAASALANASAQAAETASRTFSTSGEHAFTVPAGVSSMQATLIGGNGGAASGAGGAPGLPATVTATLAVSPGELLYLEVAGNGGAATAPDSAIGGFEGGGNGGEVFALFGTAPSGGAGGGASDIQTCSTTASACQSLASRLLVAAGGGGGGGGGTINGTPVAGGPGGAAEFPGTSGAGDGGDLVGGGAGAASHSGAGGAGTGSGEPHAGALGAGGSGADSAIVGGSGGGGGGGLYGGGGGGAGGGHVNNGSEGFGSGGGGGGGGSSGVPVGAAGVSGFALLATAHGAEPAITISWAMPPPAALTGAASAITPTSALLAGSVNPDGSQLSDCRFTLSPAAAFGDSLPCAQQIGAGETPVPVAAAAVGLSAATTYTVTLSATSAQGTSTGLATSFTTPATAPPPAALTVTALKLSPTRFRRGSRAATIAAGKHAPKKLASSTTISFALSRAASVQFGFEAAHSGVLVGHSCSAPSARHRLGRRCTRFARLAQTLKLAAHPGLDKVTFDGVLSTKSRVPPGSYRLVLIATSGASKVTAAQHPSFTLLG